MDSLLGITNLETNSLSTKDVRKKEAINDFEAFLSYHFMKEACGPQEPDPLFGGGEGEAMFKSLILQEYGKVFAKSDKGFGLKKYLEKLQDIA